MGESQEVSRVTVPKFYPVAILHSTGMQMKITYNYIEKFISYFSTSSKMLQLPPWLMTILKEKQKALKSVETKR